MDLSRISRQSVGFCKNFCKDLDLFKSSSQHTMQAGNSPTETLLHPPLKRKGSKWRGYQNPPPLTFQKSPPPGPGLHKIVHRCAVVDSAVVAEVKKSYKNQKAPKLTRVILPATTDHLAIRFNTATNARTVQHTPVRCHRLNRGETKVYPGDLATPDEIKRLGRRGFIERGRLTDESTWVKKGTHVRQAANTFARAPPCAAKALNTIIHAIGRLSVGETGTDSP